ncbi:RNApolymerase 14 kDa subunit [Prunus dulcis]|uniref:RNApolymerase 14 kDa subunit n=1 Tax=Prunus dulcis TaxID=3755 RepID=A0A4Y1QXT0_PRUDU|nr:RNApolymerase 14 kDa subunit [Prunus dulcis]
MIQEQNFVVTAFLIPRITELISESRQQRSDTDDFCLHCQYDNNIFYSVSCFGHLTLGLALVVTGDEMGSGEEGDAAKDVFNDSCQDLMVICQHVRSTFDKAVVDFRMSKSVNGMDIDSNN